MDCEKIIQLLEEATSVADLKRTANSLYIKVHPRSTQSSVTNHILFAIFPSVAKLDFGAFKDACERIDRILRVKKKKLSGYVVTVATLRALFPKAPGIEEKRLWHKMHCGPSQEEYKAVNEKMSENRDERLSDMTEVKMEEVERAVQALRTSSNLLCKVLLIQLCTGARSIEAIKISEFEALNETTIRVTGTAKTSSCTVIDKKPLILTPNELVEHVRETRALLEKRYGISRLSNTEINRLHSTGLCRETRRLGINGIKTANDLRKLYAAVVSEDFSNIHNIKQARDALGHSRYDSTLSYVNIRVV
jgi:hypothetical protein